MGSWRGVNKTRITGRQGSHAIACTVSVSCSRIDVANLYLNRQSHTTGGGSVVSVMKDECRTVSNFNYRLKHAKNGFHKCT